MGKKGSKDSERERGRERKVVVANKRETNGSEMRLLRLNPMSVSKRIFDVKIFFLAPISPSTSNMTNIIAIPNCEGPWKILELMIVAIKKLNQKKLGIWL